MQQSYPDWHGPFPVVATVTSYCHTTVGRIRVPSSSHPATLQHTVTFPVWSGPCHISEVGVCGIHPALTSCSQGQL